MTHPTLHKNIDSNIETLASEFSELILLRLGIVLHEHQRYELFKTIASGCEKFNLTPKEYLKHLQESSKKSPMLEHLISGITVGETYFFRDKQQVQILQEYVLPELIKKKRQENNLLLRIWSAGSATGEEIYSIAMMLYELLPDLEKWNIKLLATDINTNALHKAVVGSYSDWSMRSISPYYKNKYFTLQNKHYILQKKIRDLVYFDYLNLNEDSYPSIFNGTNAQDLIICRNVLIYIDPLHSHKMMEKFNHSLVSDGFLMLGASDPINLADTNLIFHHHKGMLLTKNTTTIAQISESKKPELLADFPKIKKSHKPYPAHTQRASIVKKIKPPQTAIDLANNGQLAEALKVCEENFKIEPTNPINYFTYGLTLAELNQFKEAEMAFKKSLFLDHQFVVAHFQLGLLFLRNQKIDLGIKSLKNAFKISKNKNPKELVSGVDNINYQKLTEILKKELSVYLDIKNEEEYEN